MKAREPLPPPGDRASPPNRRRRRAATIAAPAPAPIAALCALCALALCACGIGPASGSAAGATGSTNAAPSAAAPSIAETPKARSLAAPWLLLGLPAPGGASAAPPGAASGSGCSGAAGKPRAGEHSERRPSREDLLDLDLLAAAGGEAGGEAAARPGAIRAAEGPAWEEAEAEGDVLDLEGRFPGAATEVAYAYRELRSEGERTALAFVGSAGGVKLWLNGEAVFIDRGRAPPRELAVLLRLKAGPNRLLLKTLRRPAPWLVTLRLEEAAPRAAAEGRGGPGLVLGLFERLSPAGAPLRGLAARGSAGAELRLAAADEAGNALGETVIAAGEPFAFAPPPGFTGLCVLRAAPIGGAAAGGPAETIALVGDAAALFAARALSAREALARLRPAGAAGPARPAGAAAIPDLAASLAYHAAVLEAGAAAEAGAPDAGAGSAARSELNATEPVPALSERLASYRAVARLVAEVAPSAAPAMAAPARAAPAAAGAASAKAAPTQSAPTNAAPAGAGTIRGYARASSLDGSLRPYALRLPRGYDPLKRYALLLCLGAEGESALEAAGRMEGASAEDFIVAAASRRVGAEAGALELEGFLGELAAGLPVDPARVYLAGWREGADEALALARLNPGRFAAVAAFSGWRGEEGLAALAQTPLLLVVGRADARVPAEAAAALAERLRAEGGPVAQEAVPGAFAWEAWTGPEGPDRLLGWLRDRRRDSWPERVELRSPRPRYGAAAWLSVLEHESPGEPAAASARVVDERHLEVETENVALLGLDLRHPRLAGRGRIVLSIDGAEATADAGNPAARFALDPAKGGLRPQPAAAPGGAAPPDGSRPPNAGGGIVDLWHRPLVIVYGTAKARETAALRALARELARTLAAAGGETLAHRVLSDKEAAESPPGSVSLLLVGGPERNRLTARLAAGLPVGFPRGAVEVAGALYPRTGLFLLAPHPEAPGELVGLVDLPFAPAAAAAALETIAAPLRRAAAAVGEAGGPDLLVFDAEARVLRSASYDARWKTPRPRREP